jgi:hypothetical protein
MTENITEPTTPQVTDPKLRAVLDRTVREFELAANKVAANHANPTTYPLPKKAGSLEQVLARRFRELPQERRTKAAQQAAVRVKGGMDGISFQTPTPVEEQLAKRPFPAELMLSQNQFLSAAQAIGVPSKTTSSAASANPAGAVAADGPANKPGATPLSKLELRIHQVKCNDETGRKLGPFGTPGSDEIKLGGMTIDENGSTDQVSAFKVGDFDSGDDKTYSPPRRFTWFNLKEGTAFPKGYQVTLVLAEADMGGLPDFLSSLLDKVKAKVQEELKKAGIKALQSGELVTAILAFAASWVLDRVWSLIGRIWGDDVFPPQTVHIRIPSLTARWPGGKTDGPQRTVVFSGHNGKYTITYDWRLFA